MKKNGREKNCAHLCFYFSSRFQETVTQTFEITLGRPPGLVLEQVWDSSGNGEPEGVIVAGITPGSPADLSGAVEPGDRVVAISSSLGNNMWPYKCVGTFFWGFRLT